MMLQLIQNFPKHITDSLTIAEDVGKVWSPLARPVHQVVVTGLGGSGGEFENTSFSSNVQDLVAAARHLELEGCPRRGEPGAHLAHPLAHLVQFSLPQLHQRRVEALGFAL